MIKSAPRGDDAGNEEEDDERVKQIKLCTGETMRIDSLCVCDVSVMMMMSFVIGNTSQFTF